MKKLKIPGLAAVALTLVIPQIVFSDCSSPPKGFGNAWARQYQQWCESCGGTYSSRGPTCTPGPNWGGVRQGGSTAGIPSYNQEAECRRKLEADRQRQRQIGEQRKREQEEARQKQEEFERNKRDALNSMKGTGGSELGLKDAGDPNVVDLRHLDPKKPAKVDQDKLKAPPKKETAWAPADCEKAAATRKRIADGLPVQLDAIRRTEAQVDASGKDMADVSEEAKTLARERIKKEISGYTQNLLKSTQALRAQVETLQAAGVNKKTRDNLLRSLHTIVFSGEDLQKSAQAGYSAGTDLQKKMDSLTGYVVRANKLFVDSGIAEQLGETLSERAGGPLGAFAFQGATLSIDIGVLTARGKLSKDEYDRAVKNLDIMKSQYARCERRIAELDRDMAKYCTGAPRAAR